jgi:hypothetical protein
MSKSGAVLMIVQDRVMGDQPSQAPHLAAGGYQLGRQRVCSVPGTHTPPPLPDRRPPCHIGRVAHAQPPRRTPTPATWPWTPPASSSTTISVRPLPPPLTPCHPTVTSCPCWPFELRATAADTSLVTDCVATASPRRPRLRTAASTPQHPPRPLARPRPVALAPPPSL